MTLDLCLKNIWTSTWKHSEIRDALKRKRFVLNRL